MSLTSSDMVSFIIIRTFNGLLDEDLTTFLSDGNYLLYSEINDLWSQDSQKIVICAKPNPEQDIRHFNFRIAVFYGQQIMIYSDIIIRTFPRVILAEV